MSFDLYVNVHELIARHGTEFDRLEFKASWSEPTKLQVMHTICAFANDYSNTNGGYVVVGVETVSGRPVLPPVGLRPDTIESIMHEVRGICNRIVPPVAPVVKPVVVDERSVIVIWVPVSDGRPHQAPVALTGTGVEYYIRILDETVKAKPFHREQLFTLAGKTAFDDRRCDRVGLEAVSPSLLRSHLKDIRSSLVDESDVAVVLRSMRLSARVNGHEVPKNAALLFFTPDPSVYFGGAVVEVAQYLDADGSEHIQEVAIRGPLPEQIRAVVRHLSNILGVQYDKSPDRAESDRRFGYPLAALEESIVNAIYHRSYESPEPVKIHIYANRMEIVSYPGPVPGIVIADLENGRGAPVPARNRRIGELLKDARLAEARNSGIPRVKKAMAENGSPRPRYDFDEERTYFRVVLPAHPEYVALSALRDAAYLGGMQKRSEARARLAAAFQADPGSGALAAGLIEMLSNDFDRASRVWEDHIAGENRRQSDSAYRALTNVSRVAHREGELPEYSAESSTGESAENRVRIAIELAEESPSKALRLFERAQDAARHDPRARLAWAECVAYSARSVPAHDAPSRQARAMLFRAAIDLLRPVVWYQEDAVVRLRALVELLMIDADNYATNLRDAQSAVAAWRPERAGASASLNPQLTLFATDDADKLPAPMSPSPMARKYRGSYWPLRVVWALARLGVPASPREIGLELEGADTSIRANNLQREFRDHAELFDGLVARRDDRWELQPAGRLLLQIFEGAPQERMVRR
jgi:ATP-dependent DNA helicase RecG